jgi:surface polysaccharide O-acyltransferase-like enzyme
MNRQYGALSGIAIALILVNHAMHFGLEVAPVEGAWLGFVVFLQALGAFAVPAFLFISGAFVCYAANELSLTFLRNSLERILWPYVLWSLAFFLVAWAAGREAVTPVGVAKHLVVGYPYHFVPLLTVWYVLSPLVVRAGRRYGTWLVCGIAVYQAALLVVRFPVLFGVPTPSWAFLLKLPVLFKPLSDWAIYFPLGLVLALHNSRVKPTLARLRPLLVAATAGLFAGGLLNAYGIVHAPWARFVAPLPLMFVLPTIDRNAIPWLSRFEALGRRSYGVYLTHFVALNVAAWIAAGLPATHVPALLYPTFFVVALGASLGLMELLARPGPLRWAYRYLFGIVPPGERLARQPATRPPAGPRS